MKTNSKETIKNDCSEVFGIDKNNFLILNGFAINGETIKNGIVVNTLKNKQVGRRIELLEKNKFLKIISEKPYRNMEDKKIKVYGLTFKGMLASLRFTDIDENYVIKKYLDKIEDVELRKLELEYISNYLSYFFAHNKIRGILLDKIKNVGAWFYDFETSTGISKEDMKKLKEVKKDGEKSYEKVNRRLKKMYKKKYGLESMQIMMNRWHKAVEIFMEEESFEKIQQKMKKDGETVSKKKITLESVHVEEDVSGTNPFTDGHDIEISVDKYNIT